MKKIFLFLLFALSILIHPALSEAQTPQIKTKNLPAPASGGIYAKNGDVVVGDRVIAGTHGTYGLVFNVGGVCDTHEFVNALDETGEASCAQPAFSDLSGALSPDQLGNDYTNGQILVGNGLNGFLEATSITAGSGIEITSGPGTLAISATANQGAISLGTSVTVTNPRIFGDSTTGFYTPSGSVIGAVNNGSISMLWKFLSGGVDYLSITPGKTGTPPAITVEGLNVNNHLDLVPLGTGSVRIGPSTGAAALDASQNTTSIRLPIGTTGQRPTCNSGELRYNSSSFPTFEGCVNSAWQGVAMVGDATFVLPGVQAVASDVTSNWYIFTRDATLLNVYAIAKTAPLGSALIYDVLFSTNNGSSFTSIWASNPSDKIQIAASARNGSSTTFTTTTFAKGTILRIDNSQIGSSVAGSDVTVKLGFIERFN